MSEEMQTAPEVTHRPSARNSTSRASKRASIRIDVWNNFRPKRIIPGRHPPRGAERNSSHGKATPEVEICGVLIGNVFRDAAGPYLFIEACIRGDAADNHAHRSLSKPKTWRKIQDAMDRDYPDSRIVGWYHTHPGFGIFLVGHGSFYSGQLLQSPMAGRICL
jgi:hypothetical protein